MVARAFIFSVLSFLCAFADEPHWAYSALPKAAHAGSGELVDSLLRQAQESQGIMRGNLAKPSEWVRRATYTLTGLPPTPEHLARIAARADDATYLTIIDELLESPAYGERWARHWMDVARYADTRGYHFDQDNRYPFAYTYRDWLIAAFNQDLPYGKFVKLQLAADLMTDREDDPDLAALGFLTVGLRAGRVETLDDRVDVTTRGFLASTVSCARCHHHKTDEIRTEDFYSLFSIFENTEEPELKPIIGPSREGQHYEAYLKEEERLRKADAQARDELVSHFREPEILANSLHLGWRAATGAISDEQLAVDAKALGRYRVPALLQWKKFLGLTPPELASERLAKWQQEMAEAIPEKRLEICRVFAGEVLAAPAESELLKTFANVHCPLAFGASRIDELMDQEDERVARARKSEVSKLQAEHAGSPPRAMSLHDRKQWLPAQVYKRGSENDRGPEFERQWLSFLGSGPFEAGKSPRLSLAEKIADPENPLTYRVIVNRIWGWHFGASFVEPSDFGAQQQPPALLPLLDHLANHFRDSGGSFKSLHRLILTSEAFRTSADGVAQNSQIDEGNTMFWKWTLQRLDYESLRDRILAISGSLDHTQIGGRSVPLADSDSRRTLYATVDRYDLQGTFINFDLPHPDHHASRRVQTTVPQQALYFLNAELPLRRADAMAKSADFLAIASPEERISWIYQKVFQREPDDQEIAIAKQWTAAAAEGDSWADLIQMLWASNEFHFIH